jgi:hypothetical protein
MDVHTCSFLVILVGTKKTTVCTSVYAIPMFIMT